MSKKFSAEYVNEELSFKAAKKYITEYFYPLRDGRHAYKTAHGYIILDYYTLKEEYFASLTDVRLTNYYFNDYDQLFTVAHKSHRIKLYNPSNEAVEHPAHSNKKYKKYIELKDEYYKLEEKTKLLKIQLDQAEREANGAQEDEEEYADEDDEEEYEDEEYEEEEEEVITPVSTKKKTKTTTKANKIPLVDAKKDFARSFYL